MKKNNNHIKKEEVLELLKQAPWYHSYEIFPDIITPGICAVNPGKTFQSLGIDEDLTGKRILEIGTWDGPYAFELESRGADVVATDIHNPGKTGFNIGKKVLDSKVKYVRTSVYDLTKNLDEKFDIVLFIGVFYHLKYPILALEQIHEILRENGIMFFSGECFSHYAETLNNKRVRNRLRLSLFANSNIPMTLCYPGWYKNAHNWHVPNVACIQSWMKATNFKIIKLQTNDMNTWIPNRKNPYNFLKKKFMPFIRSLFSVGQRAFGSAVKINEKPVLEHGVLG